MRHAWVAMESGRRPDDYVPDMPSVDHEAGYLIGYLYEIGPALDGGPLTHQELGCWQANTGIELTAWQARTLRRLSQEYVAESHKAEKRDAQPPWQARGGKPAPTAAQLALRALAQL